MRQQMAATAEETPGCHNRHDDDCGVSPEEAEVSSQHHKLDVILLVVLVVALGSSWC